MQTFSALAICPVSPKWQDAIAREVPLYKKENDPRSEFARDYTRILHCKAYRRLKHKTQVFFATGNDHVCTRIEHVNHVESISRTIARELGLNEELTSAIALGHDIGHAPFGHTGETILEKLIQQFIGNNFWHEKNSLRFADFIETLEDDNGIHRNLSLTYAVRDGIISHCGEANEDPLTPRDSVVDLQEIQKNARPNPFTWEACVAKVADKIAYLGRDIEDALALKILDDKEIRMLKRLKVIVDNTSIPLKEINNTNIISDLTMSVCDSSNPDDGIRFSAEGMQLMSQLKEFSKKFIYKNRRIRLFEKYADLIVTSICKTLMAQYQGFDTISRLRSKCELHHPALYKTFKDWLEKYSNINESQRAILYGNKVIYNMNSKGDFQQAVVDYLSAMTDSYAIRVFHELTTFE